VCLQISLIVYWAPDTWKRARVQRTFDSFSTLGTLNAARVARGAILADEAVVRSTDGRTPTAVRRRVREDIRHRRLIHVEVIMAKDIRGKEPVQPQPVVQRLRNESRYEEVKKWIGDPGILSQYVYICTYNQPFGYPRRPSFPIAPPP